jgi:hypothetical protein
LKRYINTLMVQRFKRTLVLVCLGGISSTVYARFNHVDSLEIDPVENRNPEFYNDLISYRSPRSWDLAFKESHSGIRTSAGSLDIRRFSYLQDFKLTSSPQGILIFGYRNEREESPVFQKNLSELRVTKPLSSPFLGEMTLLGDCGLEKEYGDLGFEIKALWLRQVEVLYRFWAVDLYYNSKKEEGEDFRSRHPQSHEMRFLLNQMGPFGLEFYFLMDTPVDWQRLSKGYRYQGEEKNFGARVSMEGDFFSRYQNDLSNVSHLPTKTRNIFAASSQSRWELLLLYGEKKEGVDLLDGVNLSTGQSTRFLRPYRLFPPYMRELSDVQEGVYGRQKIERSLAEMSIEQIILQEDRILGGVVTLIEKTSRSLGGTQAALSEVRKIPQDQRDQEGHLERNAVLTWQESSMYGIYTYKDRDDTHYFWHHGFVLNHQKNNHLSNRKSIELKYILAVEIGLSDDARFYLNSTWDLDQLAHDAPYDKKSFRPWGGGNLQGILVF